MEKIDQTGKLFELNQFVQFGSFFLLKRLGYDYKFLNRRLMIRFMIFMPQLKGSHPRSENLVFNFFLFQILNHVIVQRRSREGVSYTLNIMMNSRLKP